MPTYTLRNKKTFEEKSDFMSISDSIVWEENNPDWEIACGSPVIGYNVYSIKPDDSFKDKLKEIKESNPGSTIP